MPRTVIPRTRSKKRTLSIASNSSTQSDISSSCSLESLEALSPSMDDSVENESNTADGTHDTGACIAIMQTRLKGESPAFQPMVAADTRLDTVTNAVYLALVSCGQTCNFKIEKGLPGVNPTLISAELQGGPRTCYDAIHLARQALEAITTRLDAVALLSKRVQKEDHGYSLRSSVACIPASAQDSMCWDLFHKGFCPRRCKCHWYHPQESDMGRFKVNIRCSQDVIAVSEEPQLTAGCPAMRHKISLGELVQ